MSNHFFRLILSSVFVSIASGFVLSAGNATIKIKARNLEGRELGYRCSHNGIWIPNSLTVQLAPDSTATFEMPVDDSVERLIILASDPDNKLSFISRRVYVVEGENIITVDPLSDKKIEMTYPHGTPADGEAAEKADALYAVWRALAIGRDDALGLRKDTVPASAVARIRAFSDSVFDSAGILSPAVKRMMLCDLRLNEFRTFFMCKTIHTGSDSRLGDKSRRAWCDAVDRMATDINLNNPDNAGNYCLYDILKSRFDNTLDDGSFKSVYSDSLLQMSARYFTDKYTGKVREAALANLLYDDYDDGKFNPSAPALTARFRELYPESVLLPLLENLASRNDAFNHPAESPDIIFLDSASVTSLKGVLDAYRGKPVLIDVWATWCDPCRRSFGHVGRIQEYAAATGLKLLYISLDDAADVDKWKNMARFYNLKGDHFIINPAIERDIYDTFSNGQYISIPCYAAVDRDGNISFLGSGYAESRNFEPLKEILDRLQ